jgi:hypothetical protein
MHFRARLVLVALLSGVCCIAVQDLSAQERPAHLSPIQPGARVRLRAPSAQQGRIQGEVVRISRDSVELARKGGRTIVLPLRDLSEIEQSTGRSHLEGAGVGLVAGALSGGVLVGASVLVGADLCVYVSCLRNDPAGAIGGFLIGAALSAPVGALIGSILGVERWVLIPGGMSLRTF